MADASRTTRTIRVHVSTSWSLSLGLDQAELPVGWRVEPRRSDWGKRGLRARIFLVAEGARAAFRARRCDALILCTGGIEFVVAGAVSLVLAPRQQRIAYDVLAPSSSRIDGILAVLLRPWRMVCCIRTNDRLVFRRRFGISEDRTMFVPLVAAADGLARGEVEPTDGDYVYSAGIAHRDWPTLFAALERTEVRAVIGIGAGPVPPAGPELAARLTVRGPDRPINPREGRELAAGARVVVVAMKPTDLPSGPLVLLDAMALGKPIVASAVAGVVDYCDDGIEALLVAPNDADALAEAMRRLDDDAELRRRLGDAARRRVSALTPASLLDQFVSIVDELADGSAG